LTSVVGDTGAWKTALTWTTALIEQMAILIDLRQKAILQTQLTAQAYNASGDATAGQIKAVKELIELREKYNKQKPSPHREEMLGLVNTALSGFGKGFDYEINRATPKEAIKTLDTKEITNKIMSEQVRIKGEAEKKIQPLEIEILQLQPKIPTDTTNFALFEAQVKKQADEINSRLEKIKEIRKVRDADISAVEAKIKDEQKSLENKNKELALAQKLQDSAESIGLETQEKYRNQKRMIMYNIEHVGQTVKQLKYEYMLISTSKYLENSAAKQNALAQQKVKILAAQTAEHEKQKQSVQGLLFQYEQSDMRGQRDIRRKIELSRMTPEGVSAAYSNTGEDRRLILSMIGTFTEATQELIAKQIANQAGISYGPQEKAGFPWYSMQGQNLNYNKNAVPSSMMSPVQIAKQIVGTESVNVYIKSTYGETTPESAAEAIREQLLTDDEFKKAFGKNLSKSIT